MAAIGKVEKEIEIQTPAEKLFKIFKSQCHHMPNMAKSVHAVDVHEGLSGENHSGLRKRTADDHDPIDKYMDLVVGLVKDIDDHLILQA
ncbi:hypothetical protein FNV43_RR26715 [Rhamnella rubrinervis]|uniref:Bet v I/Major latex protein domain-containing protein n=1 Tax=Rhamnella rubrinervis TaxID=2594499 RepID=A0A8K0GMS2_9ROSA|nr:hypothetical protein FNV43_RR26715 [Rhamnella rubrinervis]